MKIHLSFADRIRGPIALLGLSCVAFNLPATVQAAPGAGNRQPIARNLLHGFAAIPMGSDTLRPTERAFLTAAVETGRQQMRLAEIGASNADGSDVRSHALELASDYRILSDALSALIRRKGGIAGAPVGNPPENFQALMAKAGPEFDREFVKTSAKLTDDVMALFEQAAAEAKDSDIRELAAAQLPLLRGHRNRVTELKRVYE